MAGGIASLIATLGLDNSEFLQGLNDSVDEGSSILDGLANVGGAVATAMGAALVAAGAGAVTLLKAAADEAIAAEEVQAKLNSTLENTGKITGVTADIVNDLATNYSTLTKFEDDSIAAGGEVLARFKEINKDVFPDALTLSLDLAERLGIDVPNAAELLGKALAHPGQDLKKLKDAGVIFNDEQEKMIKTMMDAGDVAGAQALIMDVVTQAVGGSAEAAGNTASGMWTRLQNQWGNILEQLGTGLLPAITDVGKALMEYLNRPEVQAFVANLAQGIAELARIVGIFLNRLFSGDIKSFFSTFEDGSSYIQSILEVFGMSSDAASVWAERINRFVSYVIDSMAWLANEIQNNQGIVVAAIAVIVVALGAWAYTAVAAGIATIAAMWPVILVLAVVAAAAYLLYEAWTNNWGGIQEKTAAAIAWITSAFNSFVAFAKPIWDTLLKGILYLWNYWKDQVLAIIDLFRLASQGKWEEFGATLRGIFDRLIQAILTIWSTGWSLVGSAISTFISSVKSFFASADWGSIGRNIIQGIINGMLSLLGAIKNTAVNIGSAVMGVMKGFFKISSPSQLMEDVIGKNLALGVLEGWSGVLQPNVLTPALATATTDIQPRALPVSAETGTGLGNGNDAMILEDIRRLLRSQPNDIARAVRDAFEKVVVA